MQTTSIYSYGVFFQWLSSVIDLQVSIAKHLGKQPTSTATATTTSGDATCVTSHTSACVTSSTSAATTTVTTASIAHKTIATVVSPNKQQDINSNPTDAAITTGDVANNGLGVVDVTCNGPMHAAAEDMETSDTAYVISGKQLQDSAKSVVSSAQRQQLTQQQLTERSDSLSDMASMLQSSDLFGSSNSSAKAADNSSIADGHSASFCGVNGVADSDSDVTMADTPKTIITSSSSQKSSTATTTVGSAFTAVSSAGQTSGVSSIGE